MTLRGHSDSGVVVGAVWRSKRRGESYRTLTITHVDGDCVFVKRNTSRRRQPISASTLRRDYRLEREP